MSRVIALIVTDLERTRLGLRSRVAGTFADRTVLEHTVTRAARIEQVRAVVLVHPEGQDSLALLGGRKFGKPVMAMADPHGLTDAYHPMRCAARKWALSAWRGGLAGAGCHDELLPAGPMVAAMDLQKADSALLMGADWPLVDPELCEMVLKRHLDNPQAMAFTFSQAPPGLAGVAVGRDLLSEVAEKNGLFGQMLSYNPRAPQADPIGRDVCVQIDPEVRSCNRRLIYDTDRSVALMDAAADALGTRLAFANARAVTDAVCQVEADRPGGFGTLPQQITLELTPLRLPGGPVVPQHHVRLDRRAMPLDGFLRIVEQLGADGDIALTLGGLGDALLFLDWPKVVDAARKAGVLGIALQTDLLLNKTEMEPVLDTPIDILSVRLNADTAKVYELVMGLDHFAEVTENLRWLLSWRGGPSPADAAKALPDAGSSRAGLPWIVPHLVKTHQTLPDMESFYDRWVYFAGHAVIEPATTGCGLAPTLSPVEMAPPRRRPCLQIDRRMTILCDGRIAQCDQDWLGRACPGDTATAPLEEIWAAMNDRRRAHHEGRWDELELCRSCSEWHRP